MAVEAQSKLAEQLEQIVLAKIAADKLILPPLPPVALKLISLLRDPDFSTRKVVSTLEQDPLLAAKVLRSANSAAHATAGPVKSIEAAFTRLGGQKVKAVLVESSAKKIFESRDPEIAAAFTSIWEHSVAVGLMTRDLIALTAGAEQMDAGYLAGLLHDVGKPLMGAVLLDAEKGLERNRDIVWMKSDIWLDAVSRTHRKVGVALAEKWKLPEDIIHAIKDCSDYDSVNRNSLANYVRFCNAAVKRLGIYPGNVDKDDAEALVMIGRSLLGLNDEILGKISSGLAERVKQSGA
ncbi:MAG: HDOD domain-containing protein [Myxococcota bacterium]